MKLNSIIFHTTKLAELRAFYEGQLNFSVGTYVKENITVSDCSETYVNYDLGSCLLCFETDSNRTDVGTVVLNSSDFSEFRKKIEAAGIKILEGNSRYFKIKDPEGRSLLFEPA